MHPGMGMMSAAAVAAAGSVPPTTLASFGAYPSANTNATSSSYPLPSLDQLRRPVGVLIWIWSTKYDCIQTENPCCVVSQNVCQKVYDWNS